MIGKEDNKVNNERYKDLLAVKDNYENLHTI